MDKSLPLRLVLCYMLLRAKNCIWNICNKLSLKKAKPETQTSNSANILRICNHLYKQRIQKFHIKNIWLKLYYNEHHDKRLLNGGIQ